MKVLFVCLGNICRSPMAEGLFRQLVEKRGLEDKFAIDSVATSRWEVGSAPHQGTQKILKAQGISTKGMIARQITSADFEKFDLIIGMDQQNIADLKVMAPEADQHKIHLLLSVVEDAPKEVPDPYYTGDFDETYRLVSQACEAWLDELTKK